MEQKIKCKNRGCFKEYLDQENKEDSCLYHPGKPMFHDLKKGWTCCDKIVYSWDEFEKIKGCHKGKHSNVKQESANNQDAFYKSETVNRAKNGIENFKDKQTEFKSIKDFNKKTEQEEKKKLEKQPQKDKKIFLTKNGKMRCINKGCLKEFIEEENQNDNVCKYHVGAPVFHDLKKYWSCCKKETWDWDTFMKLPTCVTGKHVPKMVQLIQNIQCKTLNQKDQKWKENKINMNFILNKKFNKFRII